MEYAKLEEKIGQLYDTTKETSFQLQNIITNFEKISHDLYGNGRPGLIADIAVMKNEVKTLGAACISHDGQNISENIERDKKIESISNTIHQWTGGMNFIKFFAGSGFILSAASFIYMVYKG